MPEKRTIKKAQADKRKGKSSSTQAGEFVHEQIHHIHQGKHGAKNTKQAIAIGLSEARRSGVKVPQKKGVSKKSSTSSSSGRIKKPTVSAKRSKAATKRLKSEPKSSVSHLALSRHAKAAAKKRTHAERSASAKKAARTRAQHSRAA